MYLYSQNDDKKANMSSQKHAAMKKKNKKTIIKIAAKFIYCSLVYKA